MCNSRSLLLMMALQMAVKNTLSNLLLTKVRYASLANKEKAISYAAFRTLSEYYFTDIPMFRSLMEDLGYDPDNNSLNPNTPEGIGNLAAMAVINARKSDGSNQYGTQSGSKGVAYYDYSNYKPVNDIDKWRFILFKRNVSSDELNNIKNKLKIKL